MRLLATGLVLLLTCPAAMAETRTFALIIASNRSIEPDVPSLAYADDDAAKTFELMRALGADVELLAVLDADAQQRFPEAAKVARAPTRHEVSKTLGRLFSHIKDAGPVETVFYLFYSGHGALGSNREGQLSLQDGTLSRSDLFAEVLTPSPATWNHVVLDACHAYSVVAKRGDEAAGPDVRAALQRFLRSEDLESFPNTGVIVASSSESQTHEWSRWRSGVFSHELRSALLGAGDVDGDARVTYGEAAAAVEAANSALSDPRARLRVMARPPPLRLDEPLIDLSQVQVRTRLQFDGISGHYFVEDARGLRVADLHPEDGQRFSLTLVGQAPFFLRDSASEAQLPEGLALASELHYHPLETTQRGAVERTFHRDLYATAFGPSFYRGLMSAQGPGSAAWNGWYGGGGLVATPAESYSSRRVAGIATLTGGAVALGGALAIGQLARESYADYRDDERPGDALRHRRTTERRALLANILFGVAVAAGLTGSTLLWLELDSGEDDGGDATVVGVGARVRY